MSKYITDPQALLSSVPFSLLRDEDKEQLTRAIAPELVKIIGNAAIFPRVDELPEQVLDILAYDLKIDWYEYNAPIENKRRAVKEAMFVHRYKGTKFAVETALHSVFTNAKVEEWFEYNGEPFHFKLTVYGSSGSSNLKSLVARIQYAKNLRSVMDYVVFIIIPEKTLEINVGIQRSAMHKRIGVMLQSTDNSVFNVPVRVNCGAGVCGHSKRIESTLYNNDSSVYNARAEGKCGATPAGGFKRICTELIYKENGGIDNELE